MDKIVFELMQEDWNLKVSSSEWHFFHANLGKQNQ